MSHAQRIFLIVVGVAIGVMVVVSLASGFANHNRINRWHIDTDHGPVECVGDFDHPSCDWDHPNKVETP